MRKSTLRFAVLILSLSTLRGSADDWPQWRGPNRDGVWSEDGIIDEFDSDQLKIKWRVPIKSGYSGPTIADGRVYVTDRIAEPSQRERILCFDEETGKTLWEHEYPCPYVGIGYQAGPRANVTIDKGRAYAVGAMGHIHCLDAESGKVLWKRDLNTEYKIRTDNRASNRMPIWGIASAPLIYQNIVILHIGGREGACVVGLNVTTGEEIWRALDDRASYSAPIIVRQAGKDVAVCWTGDSVSGLDPLTGKVHWGYKFPPSRMPIGIATPIIRDDLLYVTSFYDGSLALRLLDDKLAVEKVWRKIGRDEQNTEGLHSIISTPVFIGDHIYGVDSYGELRCLDAKTGERLWENLTATPKSRWSTIHFVTNGDKVWMFNERGELIISRLSPKGFAEISRAKLIEPTLDQLRRRGGVCWAHPAYANRHVFARNDKELVCASLAAKTE